MINGSIGPELYRVAILARRSLLQQLQSSFLTFLETDLKTFLGYNDASYFWPAFLRAPLPRGNVEDDAV